MKRILFNRKFGLLDAVLKRHKTQTRRICLDPINPTANKSKWHIGDVVAISQPYKDILSSAYCDKYELDKLTHTKGWSNAMFTKADLMPHHIRITNIKIERLQDISDEDCLREGVELNTRQYEYDGTKKYCVCGLGHWRAIGCTDFDTPREAFAALIDKVSGKGTWESNPYVFVYEFELID
jgi:hypothetical protein|nr:MAG TPA: ASCH domain protein [Caudoviricetes sp.]